MKKILSIAAALILAMTLLAGCGAQQPAEITAQSLIQAAQEYSENAKSMEGNAVLTMAVSGEGMEELGGSLEVTMDMDMQTTMDPVANYAVCRMNLLGYDMDMEIYSVEEEGQLATYTNFMDQWTVQKIPFDETELSSAAESSKVLLQGVDSLTLAEETVDADGVEAYLITGTLKGEDMQELMDTVMGSMGSVLGDEESLDLSGMSVDVEYAIAKEDCRPLYMNMAINGLEDVVGEEGVAFDEFSMKMTYTAFDTVEEITVPAEAIDNAQDVSALMDGM